VRLFVPADDLHRGPAARAAFLVPRLGAFADRREHRVGVERILLVVRHVAHLVELEDQEPARLIRDRRHRGHLEAGDRVLGQLHQLLRALGIQVDVLLTDLHLGQIRADRRDARTALPFEAHRLCRLLLGARGAA
jgi:hypothetical protein